MKRNIPKVILLYIFAIILSGCKTQNHKLEEIIIELNGNIIFSESPKISIVDLGENVNNEKFKKLKFFNNINQLIIGGDSITNNAFLDICETKLGSSLSGLTISHTKIGDEGIKEIAKIDTLTFLDISNTNVTDKGIKYIKNIPHLDILFIKNTRITDKATMYLKDMSDLILLNIGKNNITDSGLENIKSMDSLIELNLSDTKISNDGIKFLKNLSNLERLNLNNTKIDDSSIPYLLDLKKLFYLEIIKTNISKKGISKLKKEMPLENCEVITNITNTDEYKFKIP